MRRVHSIGLAAVMSFSSSWAFAHAGHQHSAQGTIVRLEGQRLAVKTAEGKSETFAVDVKTVCVRGDAVLAKCDAQAGERVVVEFEESGTTRTATRLKLPVKPASVATQYVCPMHPELVSDRPGKCPRCGMTLEPKKAGK